MADKRSDVADRRYTLMWVPQGGRGSVRQVTLTMRQVRWLAVTAVFVLGLCVMGVGLMGQPAPLQGPPPPPAKPTEF